MGSAHLALPKSRDGTSGSRWESGPPAGLCPRGRWMDLATSVLSMKHWIQLITFLPLLFSPNSLLIILQCATEACLHRRQESQSCGHRCPICGMGGMDVFLIVKSWPDILILINPVTLVRWYCLHAERSAFSLDEIRVWFLSLRA